MDAKKLLIILCCPYMPEHFSLHFSKDVTHYNEHFQPLFAKIR